MKKFFTLIAAAFMAVCGYAQSVSYDFAADTDYSEWANSYAQHVCSFADATVTFASANKQPSGNTIDNCPVTKGQPVTVVLTDGTKSIQTLTFTCKQWGTKAQTITLNYSTDGGETWDATGDTSDNFSLTATLPAKTNAVKFTFSSSSNQVGIVSLDMTLASAGGEEPATVPVESISLTAADGSELGMYTGLTVTETFQLKAVVGPSNASNKKVIWEIIQDNEVISVENGLVTALAPGNAAVVVTTEDGGYQAAVTFVVSEIADATIADFLANEGMTCYLTGTVESIANTTYGNFYLTDKTGSVYVYGCLTPEGEAKKFADLGVSEGDVIKVLAKEYKMYSPKEGDPYPEAVNVVFVENYGPAPEYTFEVATTVSDFTVTPADDNVTYMVDILPGEYELLLELMDYESAEAYYDAMLEEMGEGLEYFTGVSTQSFTDDWYMDEDSEGENVIIVFAVNDKYERVSDLTIVPFTYNNELATAIKAVKAEKNGAIFNLAGQKVNANFKGIAIKNGKKVILK